MPFLPGLQLGELFYREAVRPVLEADFPGLPHAAALVGPGSEVLGFDTEMSADHGWGPRVFLFLTEADLERHGAALHERLRHRLPRHFRGYSTSFTQPNPADHGSQLLAEVADGAPVEHKVDVTSVRAFVRRELAFDVGDDGGAPIEAADWLTFPQQHLRTIVAGGVFHDDPAVGLGRLRERFAFYPRDVWRYQLAAAWTRVGQEEHLAPRAGFVGDELGSAVIYARLVRDLMRLAFLMERVYAPYPKWLGTAFARLACAPVLLPLLRGVLAGATWRERERHLAPAYEHVAAMHNALGLTAPLPADAVPFFGRPFQVIFGERFATALMATVTDPAVRRLAGRRLIGGVDLVSDNTDVLEGAAAWRPALRRLYE